MLRFLTKSAAASILLDVSSVAGLLAPEFCDSCHMHVS